MNIGILQCDNVQEKFVSQHGDYPAMFSAFLKQVDPSLTFTLYNAKASELPEHIDACDAYLITGSRHGVNDPLPWISTLETFVKKLHAAQKKVLGICFGHQLIAKALGGKVIKSPKGWGVGMSQNNLLQTKPWMTPNQEHFNLLVSHQDQVVKLPDGAEALAGSDFCPFYMMQIENTLTIQGHPEFSKAYSEALLRERQTMLTSHCYEEGLKSLEQTKDDALIAQWFMNFLHYPIQNK